MQFKLRLCPCRQTVHANSLRKHELSSPCDDGSWHFRKRTNIRRWIGCQKRGHIRALIDGQRISVSGGECQEGCIISLRGISTWGIKIHVDSTGPCGGWGQDKNKRPCRPRCRDRRGSCRVGGGRSRIHNHTGIGLCSAMLFRTICFFNKMLSCNVIIRN